MEEQPGIPEISSANDNASAPSSSMDIGGNETTAHGVESQRMCSDASPSQDFVSGILKIVPEVDVS